MKKRTLLTIGLIVFLSLGLVFNLHPTSALTTADETKMILGDRKDIGKGSVWTWLKVDQMTNSNQGKSIIFFSLES